MINDEQKRNFFKVKIAIALIILTLITFIYSFMQFSPKLNSLVMKYALTELSGMTTYVERSINKELKDGLSHLNIHNLEITKEEDIFSDKTVKKLRAINRYNKYLLVGLATLDGYGIDSKGQYRNIYDKNLLDKVKKGEFYISNIVKARHNTYLYLAKPVKYKNKVTAILWGKYKLSNMFEENKILDVIPKYFQIIDDKGNYILNTSKKYALIPFAVKIKLNLWSELEYYGLDQNLIKEIKDTISQGREGDFYFEYKGNARYCSYKPLNINNWYIISAHAQDNINLLATEVSNIVLKLFLVMLFCFLSFCVILIILLHNMYKRINNQNVSLKDMNTLFDVILKKTHNIPFVVDLKEKKVSLFGYPFKGITQSCSYKELEPNNIVSLGLVGKDSIEEYRKIYNSIIIENKPCDPVVIFSVYGDRKMWFRVSSSYDDEQQPVKIFGLLESYDDPRCQDDIKENEEHVKEDLSFDKLTHLLNRDSFIIKTQDIIHKDYENEKKGAFVIIDLDNFSNLNNLLSSKFGDIVIKKTANILASYFRQEDIVGRLGGNEFVIYARNVTDIEAFELRINKLNELLTKTYKNDSNQVVVTASIGIMLTDKEHITFNALYEKAYKALQKVKENGKNSYYFYIEE